MKDRVTAGFSSGIIAGVFMNIIDWLGYWLNLYEEQLLDWAAVVTYGALPTTFPQTLFAQLEQILFSGFMGIIFSYLLLSLTNDDLLLKGWIYGIFSWFFIYAISIAIRLPNLESHSYASTVSHFITASVYGLVLAIALKRSIRT